MIKPIVIGVIAVLWIGYALGYDKKPVPKYFHSIIHAGYLGLIILAAVAL